MSKRKIGEFIAKKRKEKNLTQQELADKVGVSATAVSHWERGKCYPDVELFAVLAEVFEVPITEMLNGEEKAQEGVRPDNASEFNASAVKVFISFFKRKIIIRNFIISGLCVLAVVFLSALFLVKASQKPTFDISNIYFKEEEIGEVAYFEVFIDGKAKLDDISDYSDKIYERWKTGNYDCEKTEQINIYFYDNNDVKEMLWIMELYKTF